MNNRIAAVTARQMTTQAQPGFAPRRQHEATTAFMDHHNAMVDRVEDLERENESLKLAGAQWQHRAEFLEQRAKELAADNRALLAAYHELKAQLAILGSCAISAADQIRDSAQKAIQLADDKLQSADIEKHPVAIHPTSDEHHTTGE